MTAAAVTEERLFPCPKCNWWLPDESHVSMRFRGDNRRAEVCCLRCYFAIKDLINLRAARRAWNDAGAKR